MTNLCGGLRPGAGRRLRRLGWLAAALLLAGCAGERSGVEEASPAAGAAGPPRLTLVPAQYRELTGWAEDRVAAAVPAFLRSCGRLLKQPDSAPLDPAARGGDFGRVGNWRPLCRQAAALMPGDDGAARRFFEANFTPVLARAGSRSEGLFTGYWEVETTGSPVPQGPYHVPVYRRPPGPAAPTGGLSRTAIEHGALAGRGLEILYLAERDVLLVLQTQGSGHVRLTDGATIRLVYDGNNGAAPGGREPPYVFFREHRGDGPLGAQGAVLTPGRSLAVDRRFIPLGVPLWLAARGRYDGAGLRRLVVAQDTGDGIAGPVRGDFFWGTGPVAAARGSRFYADGRYFLLLPKSLATRMLAAR